MDKIIGILVVDDDASFRGVVEETLSDGGFEPAVAASGEEALSLLKANIYRARVVDISFGNDRIKVWMLLGVLELSIPLFRSSISRAVTRTNGRCTACQTASFACNLCSAGDFSVSVQE